MIHEEITDQRLVEDVRPIDDALDRLSHIRGVFYNFTETAKASYGCFPDGQRVGISAQALETVLPHAIAPSVFDGVEDGEVGEYLAVRHDLVVPLLVEAFRERGEIIQALTRRVEDLEYRMTVARR